MTKPTKREVDKRLIQAFLMGEDMSFSNGGMIDGKSVIEVIKKEREKSND